MTPDCSRRLVLGVNFAPAIGNPFRSFFGYAYDGLETRLAEQRCGRDEPVVVILHLVCARIDYQDRGKTAIVLTAAIADAISAALDHVTERWAKQRKTEERRANTETKRMARLTAKQDREGTKAEKFQPEPTGVLGLKLAAEAEAVGVSFDTVLSPRRDPYNQWRWQADARWFADWFDRLVGPDGKKHLRGVHYLLVMTTIESVVRPDGKPYRNDFKSWCWLQDAAKAARWLDYLDFERIIDERNAPPLLYVPGRSEMPIASSLSSGAHCEIPPLKSLLPDFALSGFSVQQPYRLVFYGEKSSLGPILEPLDLGTELILATGESSHTLVAGMTGRAIEDGRPTVVFYFSDFDPGGHQMPISVAGEK